MHENAVIFSRCRWGIAGGLAIVALVSLLWPELFLFFGISVPDFLVLVLAALLLLANIPLAFFAGRLRKDSSEAAVEMNFWAQIALDLLAITFLVYIAGSRTSFAPFLYLVHIVLACVFFPKKTSFLIWLLSAILYAFVVALETAGIIQPQTMWVCITDLPVYDRTASLVHGASAPALWFAIWALVCMLTHAVREKDESLQAANDRLVQADKEKNSRVVRTVNDIKGAFSGIKASVDLLAIQHRENLPEEAGMHVALVHEKAEALENRLQEILMAGDVKEGEDGASCSLNEVFDTVTSNVMGRAWSRGVKVHVDLPQATVTAQAHQLAALFSSLIANGIAYSESGGEVHVSASMEDGRCRVTVSDKGAGIEESDLAYIFDDYFRGEQAKLMNPAGLGLGLGVVKDLCETLGLKIVVKSTPGQGSTFAVSLPMVDGSASGADA